MTVTIESTCTAHTTVAHAYLLIHSHPSEIFIQFYTFQEGTSNTNKSMPHQSNIKDNIVAFQENALDGREGSFNHPAYFGNFHSKLKGNFGSQFLF